MYQVPSPRLSLLNFGSISLKYSACFLLKSASCILPLPLHFLRSAPGPYITVYSSRNSSSVGMTMHPAPMPQYEDIRTVWWTRERVEIVLKLPIVGDSTPDLRGCKSEGRLIIENGTYDSQSQTSYHHLYALLLSSFERVNE